MRNILVPIDFSEMSLGAVAVARALATRFDAKVHLVHVHEYYAALNSMFTAPTMPPALAAALDEALEAELQRLKELAREQGCTGGCHVRLGAPVYHEIALIAREIGADLIVTPTHGYTGWKHIVLGSTAERIVQHAPCPVYVARRRPAKARRPHTFPPVPSPIDTIMVPVDFSACALAGLKYAIKFADRLGAKLLVVHVVFKGPAYTADGFAMYNLYPLEQEARERAEQEMTKFIRPVKFARVPYTAEVMIGPPVHTLTAVAEERKVDLIITSTHGRTGFSHVMLGSTAEQVVRHAPCSVLAVPSHPRVRQQQLRGSDKGRSLHRHEKKPATAPARAVTTIAADG